MPTFYAEDIDIYADDYVNACTFREIKELIKELRCKGYLNGNAQPVGEMHPIDEMWIEAIDKIAYNRVRLTTEEEELIKNIAARL